jgi:probable HAF family extracellular repeat protein
MKTHPRPGGRHSFGGSIPALVASVLTVAISAFLAPKALGQYTVTDLGTLGSSPGYPNSANSAATGINNSGLIVGETTTSSNSFYGYEPFSYTTGTGMVGLPVLPGGIAGFANAVNNNGVFAGLSEASGTFTEATSYTSGGVATGLGFLPGGGVYSTAWGINDNDTIVGASDIGAGVSSLNAFSIPTAGGVPSGPMTNLGTLGGSSSIALGINNGGVIVGYSTNSVGNNEAFSYTTSGGIVGLGTLGGLYSGAYAINNNGVIVGWSYDSLGNEDAFSYTTSGGMVDLGTLGGAYGQGNAINDNGVIVGSSYDSGGNEDAFIDSGGTMVDLNSLTVGSGWDLNSATGINEEGDIVGYGINPSGQGDAFLLTPNVSAVPDQPTTAVYLLAAAALALAQRVYRKGHAPL